MAAATAGERKEEMGENDGLLDQPLAAAAERSEDRGNPVVMNKLENLSKPCLKKRGRKAERRSRDLTKIGTASVPRTKFTVGKEVARQKKQTTRTRATADIIDNSREKVDNREKLRSTTDGTQIEAMLMVKMGETEKSDTVVIISHLQENLMAYSIGSLKNKLHPSKSQPFYSIIYSRNKVIRKEQSVFLDDKTVSGTTETPALNSSSEKEVTFLPQNPVDECTSLLDTIADFAIRWDSLPILASLTSGGAQDDDSQCADGAEAAEMIKSDTKRHAHTEVQKKEIKIFSHLIKIDALGPNRWIDLPEFRSNIEHDQHFIDAVTTAAIAGTALGVIFKVVADKELNSSSSSTENQSLNKVIKLLRKLGALVLELNDYSKAFMGCLVEVIVLNQRSDETKEEDVTDQTEEVDVTDQTEKEDVTDQTKEDVTDQTEEENVTDETKEEDVTTDQTEKEDVTHKTEKEDVTDQTEEDVTDETKQEDVTNQTKQGAVTAKTEKLLEVCLIIEILKLLIKSPTLCLKISNLISEKAHDVCNINKSIILRTIASVFEGKANTFKNKIKMKTTTESQNKVLEDIIHMNDVSGAFLQWLLYIVLISFETNEHYANKQDVKICQQLLEGLGNLFGYND